MIYRIEYPIQSRLNSIIIPVFLPVTFNIRFFFEASVPAVSFGKRFVAEVFATTIDSITLTLAVVALALSVAVNFAGAFAIGVAFTRGVAGGVAGSVVLAVADVDLDVDVDAAGGFVAVPFDGVVVVVVSAVSASDIPSRHFHFDSVL